MARWHATRPAAAADVRPTPNTFVGDKRWGQLFDELRLALHELGDLEPRVTDAGASDKEWTKAWGEYSGLLSRIGHLQQQLLKRRMELLGLTKE